MAIPNGSAARPPSPQTGGDEVVRRAPGGPPTEVLMR